MSRPAVVPQVRPAGNWPQWRMTFGAGFGSPWPVIGLPAAVDVVELGAALACSPDPPAPHAARRSVAPAPTTRCAIRDVDIGLLEFERDRLEAGRCAAK